MLAEGMENGRQGPGFIVAHPGSTGSGKGAMGAGPTGAPTWSVPACLWP